MRPYYEADGITIYHGDAINVMGGLPPASVGVFVTDPPYGTRTTPREEWMVGEYSNVMPLALPEMYRLGVHNAAIYLFSSWMMLADWSFRCSPYFRHQGTLVWDKGRHSGCWGKFSWQFHWEAIYYGLKGPRETVEYFPDVIRSNERPEEPMQKPIGVCERLIRASAGPDCVILDPFIGSGSTLVAAKNLGRRAIGIEIEERYCEIAAKRLSQQVLDLGGAA